MPARRSFPSRSRAGSRPSCSTRDRSGSSSSGRHGRWMSPSRLIDGTAISRQMRAELAPEIAALKAKGVTPGLAVVLVGENPASQVYVRMKGKASEEAGIHSETVTLPADTPESRLLAEIDRLNADPRIHGILVQLPLPKQIAEPHVLLRVAPAK